MRFRAALVSSLLFGVMFCHAGTLTDPFGQSQDNCNFGYNAPYSSCDVIGDERLYDIQSASFSVNNGMISVVVHLNSAAVQSNGQQLSLYPFDDAGLTLMLGDIFFYSPEFIYDPSDPASAQALEYGIALTDHNAGFVPGGLYAIGGGLSAETAQQALGDNPDYFRRDQAVLMTGSGAPVSTGSVSVANAGDGVTNALYAITVTVPATTGFLNLVVNGQIGMLFSSADCGNDVVQGLVAAPEPAPGTLVVIGIVLLAAGSLWRRRRAD